MKITSPVYKKIALDIATRIVEGEYKVGEKVYARSNLATQYAVSPETARRAISVLVDLGVVESTKGSGVQITSYEAAVKFLSRFEDSQTLGNLKQEIEYLVNQEITIAENIQDKIRELVDKTERFTANNPFTPFEIKIKANMKFLEKSASEINFWHNTSATIIAIKRGEDLLISPGPYTTFLKNDIVYCIGDENAYSRVNMFLYNG